MKKDMDNFKFIDALKNNDKYTMEVKQQPSKDFADALKELDYMEKHPEKYKIYHDVDKMFNDILNEE